ncbi:DUF916 and DUF3324 domain-containing protein [Agrilactobacillus fermenti]|uniref:DUF916 and DUF3324 domain-containing protein n=1 Tax=Agrilactobacillus fermenti TaxID=2586909 RepID=UPI001E3204CF|nr:DUF916 and DUF3324 domain-containing protein [Agrilactobacillus fermenti]MCD2256946.1 DUF916 and DUF3324 domain-containing protein [Agrilactobacillus fermenti]
MLFFSVLMLGVSFNPKKVQAVQVPDIPVSVEPVYPDIQKETSSEYFNFSVKPGDVVPTNLKLVNTSDKSVVLRIQPVPATTTPTGDIDYSPHKGTVDGSLKYNFAKLGPTAEKITLKPKETRIIDQKVSLQPDMKFKGMILGGFYIWSPSVNASAQKAAIKRHKTGVYNTFGMYIGVTMHVGDDSSVFPDFRLRTVKPSIQGAEPVVLANLQNFKPQAVTNKSMTIKAKVYHRGGQSVVKETGNLKFSFAPNSNTDIPISWGKSRMAPGKYTLKMTAKTGLRTWHFTRNFTITPQQSAAANKLLPKTRSYLWLWILLVAVVVLLAIASMAYLYRRGINKGRNQTGGRSHSHRHR